MVRYAKVRALAGHEGTQKKKRERMHCNQYSRLKISQRLSTATIATATNTPIGQVHRTRDGIPAKSH